MGGENDEYDNEGTSKSGRVVRGSIRNGYKDIVVVDPTPEGKTEGRTEAKQQKSFSSVPEVVKVAEPEVVKRNDKVVVDKHSKSAEPTLEDTPLVDNRVKDKVNCVLNAAVYIARDVEDMKSINYRTARVVRRLFDNGSRDGSLRDHEVFVKHMRVSTSSPLEGIRTRFTNGCLGYNVMKNHKLSTAVVNAQLFCENAEDRLWYEIETEADWSSLVRSWAAHEKILYHEYASSIVHVVFDQIERESKTVSDIAAHGMWELACENRNHDVIFPNNDIGLHRCQKLKEWLMLRSETYRIGDKHLLSPDIRLSTIGIIVSTAKFCESQPVRELFFESQIPEACMSCIKKLPQKALLNASISNDVSEKIDQDALDEAMNSLTTLHVLIEAMTSFFVHATPEYLQAFSIRDTKLLVAIAARCPLPRVRAAVLHLLSLILKVSVLEYVFQHNVQQRDRKRWVMMYCTLGSLLTSRDGLLLRERLTITNMISAAASSSFMCSLFGLKLRNATKSKPDNGDPVPLVTPLSFFSHILTSIVWTVDAIRFLNKTLGIKSKKLGEQTLNRPVEVSVTEQGVFYEGAGKDIEHLKNMLVSLLSCVRVFTRAFVDYKTFVPIYQMRLLWKTLIYAFANDLGLDTEIISTLACSCVMKAFVPHLPSECNKDLLQVFHEARTALPGMETNRSQMEVGLAFIFQTFSVDLDGCRFLNHYMLNFDIFVSMFKSLKDNEARQMLGRALTCYCYCTYSPTNLPLNTDSQRQAFREDQIWSQVFSETVPDQLLVYYGLLPKLGGTNSSVRTEARKTIKPRSSLAKSSLGNPRKTLSRLELAELTKLLNHEVTCTSPDPVVARHLWFAIWGAFRGPQNGNSIVSSEVQNLLACVNPSCALGIQVLQPMVYVFSLICTGPTVRIESEKHVRDWVGLIKLAFFVLFRAGQDGNNVLAARGSRFLDSLLVLLWKMAENTASFGMDPELLRILYSAICDPLVDISHKCMCASILYHFAKHHGSALFSSLSKTLINDLGGNADDRKEQDALLDFVLHCLNNQDLGLRGIGALLYVVSNFDSFSDLRFETLQGGFRLLEMAWQTENHCARLYALHAIHKVLEKNESVQVRLAKYGLLPLVILAQYIASDRYLEDTDDDDDDEDKDKVISLSEPTHENDENENEDGSLTSSSSTLTKTTGEDSTASSDDSDSESVKSLSGKHDDASLGSGSRSIADDEANDAKSENAFPDSTSDSRAADRLAKRKAKQHACKGIMEKVLNRVASNANNRTTLYKAELLLKSADSRWTFENYELEWKAKVKQVTGQWNRRLGLRPSGIDDFQKAAPEIDQRESFLKWIGNILADAPKASKKSNNRVLGADPTCTLKDPKLGTEFHRNLCKPVVTFWRSGQTGESTAKRWSPRVDGIEVENVKLGNHHIPSKPLQQAQYQRGSLGDKVSQRSLLDDNRSNPSQRGLLGDAGNESPKLKFLKSQTDSPNALLVPSLADTEEISEETREEILNELGLISKKLGNETGIKLKMGKEYGFRGGCKTRETAGTMAGINQGVHLFKHVEGSKVYEKCNMSQYTMGNGEKVYLYSTVQLPIELPTDVLSSPELGLNFLDIGLDTEYHISTPQKLTRRMYDLFIGHGQGYIELTVVENCFKPLLTCFDRLQECFRSKNHHRLWTSEGKIPTVPIPIAILSSEFTSIFNDENVSARASQISIRVAPKTEGKSERKKKKKKAS